MWQFKILAVSWLCVLWTKLDSASTEDIDVSKYPELGTSPTKSGFGFEDVEATKKYSADSTVRSFFPIEGNQKWMRRGYPSAEEMLFFNVSIVGDNEEVSLAELHLHRRRIAKIHGSYHKRFLPLPYRVVLYQVQPNYKHKFNRDARTAKLASIPVFHTTKSGWHTLDVTAVLRELLINAQGPVELLLGVQFEAPKGGAKSLVPLKHFLKPAENSEPDHPYRASSYLVIFSEIDHYFDEFNDDSNMYSDETENDIPDGHVFRERHLKHKIFKVKSSDDGELENKKYKAMENEVYKTDYGMEDVVRHKSKHRASDVKRSKADELALQQKNKLKSLPFLHTNEVEEIRQTSRRLTRSISGGNATRSRDYLISEPRDIKRALSNVIKDMAGPQGTGDAVACVRRSVAVRMSDVDFGVQIVSPESFVTVYCGGSCLTPQGRRSCKPIGRRSLDFAYYDASGRMIVTQLNDFLASDCECR